MAKTTNSAQQREGVIGVHAKRGDQIEPASQAKKEENMFGVGSSVQPHPKLATQPAGDGGATNKNAAANEQAERSQKERQLTPAPTNKLSKQAQPTLAPTPKPGQ